MGRRIDLSDQKYRSLTVIKDVGSNGSRRLWQCKCDCGILIVCTTRDLREERKTSCGCGIGIHGNTKYKNRKDALISDRISKYKSSAKHRSLDWNLTFDNAKTLLLGKCFYCDTEPTNRLIYRWFSNNSKKSTKEKASNIQELVNGIDRIDNTKGYTQDNCVSCCVVCNKSKNNQSIENFLNWIKKVYNKQWLKE